MHFFYCRVPSDYHQHTMFHLIGKLQMLLKFGAVFSVDIGNETKRYKQPGADVRWL